jgi:hypothetical protein
MERYRTCSEWESFDGVLSLVTWTAFPVDIQFVRHIDIPSVSLLPSMLLGACSSLLRVLFNLVQRRFEVIQYDRITKTLKDKGNLSIVSRCQISLINFMEGRSAMWWPFHSLSKRAQYPWGGWWGTNSGRCKCRQWWRRWTKSSISTSARTEDWL